jgi:hypothetical protein
VSLQKHRLHRARLALDDEPFDRLGGLEILPVKVQRVAVGVDGQARAAVGEQDGAEGRKGLGGQRLDGDVDLAVSHVRLPLWMTPLAGNRSPAPCRPGTCALLTRNLRFALRT